MTTTSPWPVLGLYRAADRQGMERLPLRPHPGAGGTGAAGASGLAGVASGPFDGVQSPRASTSCRFPIPRTGRDRVPPALEEHQVQRQIPLQMPGDEAEGRE